MPDTTDDRLRDLSDRLAAVETEAAELRRRVEAYRSGDSDEADEDLMERLREGALRLEATHPDLTHVIARVIDSLTAAGI